MELSPRDITIEALQSGRLRQTFPLWYELEGIVENNGAHKNQRVDEHTLAVLGALEENFKLSFIKDAALKEKLRAYLDDTPDILSRRTLIFLATVLHDIGKRYTLVEVSPGVFVCPGHEAVSAGMAREYLEMITLTPRERNWIMQFIVMHGYIHGVLVAALKREDPELFSFFHAAAGDMTAGLLLFVLADDQGSDLKTLDPALFEQRARVAEKLLEQWHETV